MQNSLTNWLRMGAAPTHTSSSPSSTSASGHKRKADEMTRTPWPAMPPLERVHGDSHPPPQPPPSMRIMAVLDPIVDEPIVDPIVSAVDEWQQVKREGVKLEEQQQQEQLQQQQRMYDDAVAVKREESLLDENAMVDDDPFSPIKSPIAKARVAFSDLTNKSTVTISPAVEAVAFPCKSPEPLDDDDLASVTSQDDEGYAQSVHHDPATTSADAIKGTTNKSKQARLTAHYNKLRWGHFDTARCFRIHSFDGQVVADASDKISLPHYAACQSDDGEIRWIVQYKLTKAMMFPLLFKMVVSRDQFETKRDSLRLDAWNRAPRVRDAHPLLCERPQHELEQWMGQLALTALYPSGPTHAAFSFSTPAAPVLWTRGVDDCVALVGLGGPAHRAGVLAHLPARVNLVQLEAYWADQNLGDFSSWSVLTNQLSPFAVRILRLVQRMRGGSPVQPSVYVDAPAHIVAQHGWIRRRGKEPMRYLKQYFNPVGIEYKRLEPNSRIVVVDAQQSRIWAT